MYLLAIFIPPLAVILCGKPVQAVLNFVLCLFLWIPAVIHAWMIVKEKKENDRLKMMMKIMK